jgi:hypothetical protein
LLSALLLDDEAALSELLEEGRLSVMYQPEPLKMIGGGLTTRRTACPVSGQTASASSWNPWRTSKRVPSARSYS